MTTEIARARDLTACEVAAEMAVSKRKVLYLLETGELTGYRIGSLWRITRGAVDDYKRKHTANVVRMGRR